MIADNAACEENLIAELETAVRSGSAEARVGKLRQVAALFLAESAALTEKQVEVFDDVLCRLTARIETKVLAELSHGLAPVDNAPVETIKQLARHDAINVAGPVLTTSKRLTTEDLTEIAQSKGQDHLVAISKRETLESVVTDVLVQRGNQEVLHTLATNSGAQFSSGGYTSLIEKADGNEILSEAIGSRLDIPARLLRDLLARATDAVRARLLAVISPERREEFTQILAAIASAVSGASKDDKYAEAEKVVQAMKRSGDLNDRAIREFAGSGKLHHLVTGLALLASSKIDVISEILGGVRNDAVLIPCKVSGLSWETVEAVLRSRHGKQTVSDKVLELARNDYKRLSVETAQKTLRFLQIRATVA